MAVQALYRRWRPQSFDEVIGQAHITRTLQNAVANDRIVHAYLFSGPRGTGKTSVARILAKAVNCIGEGAKPCNECDMCRAISEGRCLDLIEIDAASNTGVDDVRDLREKIGFAPNEASYKVYVVDEVHMLSRAAFNALLKTLEEPPPHAVFVLATTEQHRIPDTILSRCQQHGFRRVGVEELVGKLERIVAAEGVTADRAALEMVARSATGSMRDAESLLDQLVSMGDNVDVEQVRVLLGTPAAAAVVAIVDAMIVGDSADGLRVMSATIDQGVDPIQLRARILEHLRGLLLIQTGVQADLLKVADDELERLRAQAAGFPTTELAASIHRFNDARSSSDHTQPALGLELALVETILAMHDGRAVADARPALKKPQLSDAAESEDTAVTLADNSDSNSEVAAGAAGAAGAAATTITDAPAQAGPSDDGAAEPHPKKVSAEPDQAAVAAVGQQPTEPDETSSEPTKRQMPASRTEALSHVEQLWPDITAAVAKRDKNTAALLKDCRPVAADDTSVTIGFFYEFHCKRVSEPRRLSMVTAAFAETLGEPRELRCRVVAPTDSEVAARPRSKSEQAEADPLVRHAIDNLGARVAGVKPHEEDELKDRPG